MECIRTFQNTYVILLRMMSLLRSTTDCAIMIQYVVLVLPIHLHIFVTLYYINLYLQRK